LWLFGHGRGRDATQRKFLNQDAVAPIDFTRAASRETLRDIVFLWTTPFCADFIMIGSAAFRAVSARCLLRRAGIGHSVVLPGLNVVFGVSYPDGNRADGPGGAPQMQCTARST
jgi:hypothetical protein